MERRELGNGMKQSITIKEFDSKEFPDSRFTMATMDLPINTMVSDVPSMRRVGYWNGARLQEEMVDE